MAWINRGTVAVMRRYVWLSCGHVGGSRCKVAFKKKRAENGASKTDDDENVKLKLHLFRFVVTLFKFVVQQIEQEFELLYGK